MVFSSLTFLLLFLPILTVVYFLIPKKYRTIRNMVLLVFSIVFYGWGEPIYIFLILLTIALTYFLSGGIARKEKWALIAVVVVNLLPLAVYKYADFIIGNINLIPGIEIPKTNLPLPIGISFYTFQMLTYIIDLYRGKVCRQKNPLNVALYILLFPQLIAGPIVRYETIENEITGRNENWNDFSRGVGRFLIGLSKKVLIANQAGYIVAAIKSAEQSQVGPGLLWLAVFAYAIQIYFDFSGYSDMAIGLGWMFGFHFLENFNYPYISKSITEFWRRWHISLSTFFRDYLYIPLGGNRVKAWRWVLNMLIVWFLTGLWHGPYWNYITWGLFYFVLLVLEKQFLQKFLDRIPGIISWAYTFFMTLIGWTIFMNETDNFKDLFNNFKRMFSFAGLENGLTIRALELQPYIPYILIGFILSVPVFAKLKEMKFLKSRTAVIAADLAIFVLYAASVIYIVSESFNPFIYFRF